MTTDEAVALGADCPQCPLRGRPIVPPKCAEKSPKLIVVGEGPGKEEERRGTPFVGPSGKMLDAELRRNDVSRDDCHITNTALCRGDTDKENEKAFKCCAPRLLREMATLPQDTPILSVGAPATRALLGARSILTARGFVWRAPLRVRTDPRSLIFGRRVFPTIHPAFILRGADTWAPLFRIDVRRACRAAMGGAPEGATEDNVAYSTGDPSVLTGFDGVVSCDIETDGIDPMCCRILCVGFSDGVLTRVVWPWRDDYSEAISRFLRSRRSVVFHNGFQFDQIALLRAGVSFDGVTLEDTLLAHHSYASHFPQRLDQLVSEYCDAKPWKIEYGFRAPGHDDGEDQLQLSMPAPGTASSAEGLCAYNATDASLTARVWHKMQLDLAPERNVYQHDLALAALCRDMTRTGIGVDVERLREVSTSLTRESATARAQMRVELDDPTFSPERLSDVRRAVFETMRAPSGERTARGQRSTAALTIEAFSGAPTPLGRFADALLRWRLAQKVKSTYVDAIVVNPSTGRVHCNWKPFGTVSGRLSGRLQSVPRWAPGDVCARVREIYVPWPGNVFVYFDVSQAEMRIAAYLSADSALMKACELDVHAGNAKVAFPEIATRGWLDGDAKKDPIRGKPYRDIAKNLGFAILYGAEPPKVFLTLRAAGFDVTLRAVETILRNLRGSYKAYYAYVSDNLRKVQKEGFLRSPLLGRIRWFGWTPAPTDVANYPVQSFLADVMNRRMIDLAPRLPVGAELVAQIHDACIFDCTTEAAGRLEAMLHEQWAAPIQMVSGDLILPIEIKRGNRWSEL